MKSLTDSGHQRYQLLSNQSKQSTSGKSLFSGVKPLQLPQSATSGKHGHLVLVNRLSSEGSSIQNESEAHSKMITIVHDSAHKNSTEQY